MVIIGTRGSPLALAQANMVASLLAEATGRPVSDFPLRIIRTTGDATQDRALADIGGKGLFTKEIDQAQLDGEIDIAVHSSKDLPTMLPAGLAVLGYLEREDVRDAFIGHGGATLAGLPQGAVVGTVSLRRQALLRRVRPDIRIVIFRGNVGTRLAKVAAGEVDGTLLAVAGLKRLGLAGEITEHLDIERFPPAVGQAAIGIVTRTGDDRTNRLVTPICHQPTGWAITAERAMLTALDGSCRTPIAGYARIEGEQLRLDGLVLSPDGQQAEAGSMTGPYGDAGLMGLALGERLKAALSPAMLESIRG